MTESEFEKIVLDLKSDNPDTMVQACEKLQKNSTPADVPKLLELLDNNDFILREAAAWPLSDMGWVEALPKLLFALQRGFDEGYDNDGLQASISDMAMLNKTAVKAKLFEMQNGADEKLKENIDWLLEYCELKMTTTIKDGASPHNKSIELSARGWHGPRGARPAPVPCSPSASQAGFRPCSQLIDMLYGR